MKSTVGALLDLAPDQIRVNTVCIGLSRSGQLEDQWKRDKTGSGVGRVRTEAGT